MLLIHPDHQKNTAIYNDFPEFYAKNSLWAVSSFANELIKIFSKNKELRISIFFKDEQTDKKMKHTPPVQHISPDDDGMNKTIIGVYALYIISVILNLVPKENTLIFGMILISVTVIATRYYRNKARDDSLMKNHMNYILKSLSRFILFLIIGMIAAYLFANQSQIEQTWDGIMNGMFVTEDQLSHLMMDYLKQNMIVFTLTLGPSVIYLMYRLVKGMILARDNRPVLNLKNWF